LNSGLLNFSISKKKSPDSGFLYVKFRKSGTLQMKYKDSLDFQLLEMKNTEKVVQFVSKYKK
jgi:hypothetical protein